VEKLAIQRNQDVGRQVNELNVQLAQSKKELDELQSSGKFSVDQKNELEKKVEALSAENAKALASVKIAILPEERDQIVARMEQNDVAVKNAMGQISSLDRENVTLKEQVIQSYFDLGNMFYDLGRYQEAVAQYLHVLEWNPQHAWAHHNLAVIYDYHLHRVNDAIVQYRAYMNVKLASEEARESRMRLWDLEQTKSIAPAYPLKKEYKDYREFQKI
ncbi:MAG: tetratricopeptide repeat protein, partial [bacterium]